MGIGTIATRNGAFIAKTGSVTWAREILRPAAAIRRILLSCSAHLAFLARKQTWAVLLEVEKRAEPPIVSRPSNRTAQRGQVSYGRALTPGFGNSYVKSWRPN